MVRPSTKSLAHLGDKVKAIEALRRGATLLDPAKALSWLSRTEYDLLRSDPEFQKLVEDLGSQGK